MIFLIRNIQISKKVLDFSHRRQHSVATADFRKEVGGELAVIFLSNGILKQK
jgi:hypothetical protein